MKQTLTLVSPSAFDKMSEQEKRFYVVGLETHIKDLLFDVSQLEQELELVCRRLSSE
jgi:hypothetical protein